MILQIHPALGREINRGGCYKMSFLFLANKHTGILLDVPRILQIYRDAVAREIMTRYCYINDPNGLGQLVGFRVEYTDRHESPARVCAADEVEILCFERPRPEKGPEGVWRHFVAGDGQGHVAYDPMGCSRTVLEGTLVSKRIFRMLRESVVGEA